MTETGSDGAHGSTISLTTAASARRSATPEYSQTYGYAGGGEVVVPHSRRQEALKSKNERKKFASELRTARVFAQAGHKIAFTPHGASTHDVYCDGIPADIKKLSSANNIVRHAKHATRKQGAKMVLFEFSKQTPYIHKEVANIAAAGIRGKYFFSGNREIIDF